MPLIGPLVMSSLMSVQERGMTLETRGFGTSNKKVTSFTEVEDTQKQKLTRKIMVILAVCMVVGSILYKFL